MTLEKVQSGQPMRIKAQTFNTILDATRAYQERSQRGGAGVSQSTQPDSNLVLVKNNSGSDVGRFGVLGISGVLYSPTDNLDRFKNQPVLLSLFLGDRSHEGKYVVAQEPIANEKIGQALVAGVTPVQINVTNENHTHATLMYIDGSVTLHSAFYGENQILWKESGTGTKWSLVRLGSRAGRQKFLAKITQEAAAGGGAYDGWAEQTYNASGNPTALTGGRTNALGNLVEINGVEEINANTYVEAWEETDGSGNTIYRFLAAGGGSDLPTPTTQYKVLAVVSDGEGGLEWGEDWVRFSG